MRDTYGPTMRHLLNSKACLPGQTPQKDRLDGGRIGGAGENRPETGLKLVKGQKAPVTVGLTA